ncbi:pentapeptide repeat-containing protein [Micromonospora aurantiaca]|uniref:pentapeptide repeat-containing protein n=1 Tax=Micromonospora aurantiaca (nom. illeg.) TaxID=47850 RepID=UPI0038060CCA
MTTRRLSVALMVVGGVVLLTVALVLVPRPWWNILASGWSLLVPVAVGLAVLVTGVLLWRRDDVEHQVSAAPTPPDRQVRPLRSWVVPVGVVLVGVVTWAAVTWLQGSVPAVGDQVERAKVRIESIRTGLTIGAAVTGAFVLLLAFRRQQLAERTQQATEYDAGEKRVTELYVKAADQLGSDKAPVRLAGLYALERLAHDNPIHRQSIVEVICAYLRMPFTPPDGQPTPTAPPPADAPDLTAPTAAPGDSDKPAVDPREERQVRLAAQRILARHLRPTTPEGGPNPLHWGPKVTLDLTEAVLIDLDLGGCHLHNATFTKTHFSGVAGFGGATFSGVAGFGGATFSGDAGFGGATFSGDARFGEVTFSGVAGFGEVTFSGVAGFGEVTFSGVARFGGATFSGDARFDRAKFDSGVGFGGAMFDSIAGFAGVMFSGGVGFVGAKFSGVARFDGATFRGDARFDRVSFSDARFVEAMFSGVAGFGGATFSGDARFDRVSFSDARFGGAMFSGVAGFGLAMFSGDARFGGTMFSGVAGFGGATFSGDARFDRVSFSDARFDGAMFSGVARFGRATFNGAVSFDGATLGGVRYDGPGSVAE